MAFEMNHTALLGFRTRYETMFNQAYNYAKPDYDKICLVMDSGPVEQVTHRWLRGLKFPQQFVTQRKTNMPSTDGFTIVNNEYEWTYGIKRKDFERDQYKVYDPLVTRGGQLAQLYRDQLVFTLIKSALATPSSYLAYDGIAFFGNHNANRAFSFNNASTGALTLLRLQAAFAAVYGQARDTEGAPLIARSGRPLVVTGTKIAPFVTQLKTQAFLAGTQVNTGVSSASSQATQISNPLVGTFDDIPGGVVWLPDDYWFVFLADALFKPVIFQNETPLEFYAPPTHFLTDWDDNAVFKIGTYERFGYGLGLPEMSWGSTGAVA